MQARGHCDDCCRDGMIYARFITRKVVIWLCRRCWQTNPHTRDDVGPRVEDYFLPRNHARRAAK